MAVVEVKVTPIKTTGVRDAAGIRGAGIGEVGPGAVIGVPDINQLVTAEERDNYRDGWVRILHDPFGKTTWLATGKVGWVEFAHLELVDAVPDPAANPVPTPGTKTRYLITIEQLPD